MVIGYKLENWYSNERNYIFKKKYVVWEFMGLSTDIKPEEWDGEPLVNGCSFLEIDTKELYYWNGKSWGGQADIYAYKDGETLVITYDKDITKHEVTYTIPAEVTQASDWGWYAERDNFKTIKINANVKNYDGFKNMNYMFYSFRNILNFEGFENLNTTNVTSMINMFNDCGNTSDNLNSVPNVSNWDTSKVTDISYMFCGYGYGSSVLDCVPDVSKWDTSNITNYKDAFAAYGFKSTNFNSVPDVSKWNTSKAIRLDGLFYNYGAGSEVLDKVPNVSAWDIHLCKNINSIFFSYGFNSKTLNAVPDVSKWVTYEVEDMGQVFYDYGCKSDVLSVTPDVLNWDTRNADTMASMFREYGGSSKLVELPKVYNFKMNKVTNMEYMFQRFGAGKGYGSFRLFSVPNAVNNYQKMLEGVKLTSITITPRYSVGDWNTAGLTNSKGEKEATWYTENGEKYEKCNLPHDLTVLTTYYDYTH